MGKLWIGNGCRGLYDEDITGPLHDIHCIEGESLWLLIRGSTAVAPDTCLHLYFPETFCLFVSDYVAAAYSVDDFGTRGAVPSSIHGPCLDSGLLKSKVSGAAQEVEDALLKAATSSPSATVNLKVTITVGSAPPNAISSGLNLPQVDGGNTEEGESGWY